MDSLDKRLLEALQRGLPLISEPFTEIGSDLGLSPQETLRRIQALRQERIIREIGALFDSRALGYQSTLVALSLPPEKLETAAALINQHPGVSHNYVREHRYNLWFTLAVPPEENLEMVSREMARQAGTEDMLFLPAVRVFKIGAFFNLSGDEVAMEASVNGQPRLAATPPHLTPEEIALVRELQQDFPLVERPFKALAQRLGMEEAQVIGHAQSFLERGLMRRLAALLYHRHLGFLANGMGCWLVPSARLEAVGKALAQSPRVTHCYQRVTYPQWPYNIFTMVHAPTREECQAVTADLAQRVGIKDYIVLFSSREFKKARVKYYW